jgi:class 3 adenylate cyclase/tetratricopeptide (TPR) repeat protein
MQQIADWLKELGISEYTQRFVENDIDVSVLPHLTDQDLKELGVSLGHRRKMLAAIAELAGSAGWSSPRPALIEPKRQDTAERRQVTVMFSDLVGSTALAARMDPEDLREVIAIYHKCAAEMVRGFGGFVSQYLGDGVLVYFGYPQAHEDDAERAVRAGLDLIAAVEGLKTRVSLQTRVGIATGLVVVGDLVDAGGSQERGIIGETPNLAARLQGVAEPNMLVIAEGTRKLLGNLFELEDLGAKDLKGIAGPMRVWAVLRASSVESRFEALHATELTILVGREEEFELLLRRWSTAKSGEGQVVLLSGEAGIGKSRLTAAILERLAAEPHTRLRYFCSPQHTDSALYPIIGQLERAAGLARDDTPQTRLDKLDALLAQASTSAQDAALFAEMLSLLNDGRYPTLELAPQERRQRTMEALTARLEALTRQRPVLEIFEDAHWADPTSLEALGRAVDRIRTLPVMLIATFRPEFEPPWIGQPHVTALTINRLTEREAGAIIDRIVGNKLLPASIRQDIIERTDGIPLFVEEMTKAVLEAESEGAAVHAAAAVPSPAVTVPASLHASLMARLDRLGPAKELAQIGAAIGREFAHALFAAVVQHRPEGELISALDRLTAAGLLFRQGLPPHANYLFKHALVQDAAYSTLLRAPRQKLHARIAEVLQQQFPERTSAEPELLARHFAEGGQVEVAISYWLKAGHRAAERSADEEAVRHLRRGLKMLMSLPDSAEKDRLELDFQLALGTPLSASQGYGSDLVGAARDRAITLCEKLDHMQHLLPILYGQYTYCIASGRIPDALKHSERCHSIAATTGDRVAHLIACRAMGASLMAMGQFEAARAQLEQLLAIEMVETDRSLTVQYVADPLATGLAYLAVSLWVLGYPDQAIAAREKAFKHALDTNHANTNAIVSIYAGTHLSVLLNNIDDVTSYLEILNARFEGRVPQWATSCGEIMRGWGVGCAGHLDDGIALLKHGIDAYLKQAKFQHAHYHSLLAILQARAGNINDSLSAIRKAKELIAESGEYFWHADVLRIEGELALLFGTSTKKAEASFVQALEVARKQQAKSFELRAATSIARLWCDHGKRKQARELLAPIFGWFTEGFDTRDLTEARTLLGTLAS